MEKPEKTEINSSINLDVITNILPFNFCYINQTSKLVFHDPKGEVILKLSRLYFIKEI